MIGLVGWLCRLGRALRPYNRKDSYDWSASLVFVELCWALLPCSRCDNFESNCRFRYVEVGWALPPCNRRDCYDRNVRLVYVELGWALRRLIVGMVMLVMVGCDIVN
jgi:hypothetical protein